MIDLRTTKTEGDLLVEVVFACVGKRSLSTCKWILLGSTRG